MIACPTCNVSFSPRHRICPRCNRYRARLEDRLEYLAGSAEIAFERGATIVEIEAMLVEEGVSALEASEITSLSTRKAKRVARSYGLFRLGGGLGALVLAGILVLIVMFSPSGVASRMMVGDLLLAATGLSLASSGLYGIVTGRER